MGLVLGCLIGKADEPPLMVIGGSLVLALDLLGRLKGEDGHLFYPSRGRLLFFPLWILGLVCDHSVYDFIARIAQTSTDKQML